MTTAFDPHQIGNRNVKNRIAMAPMTRSRADDQTAVATEIMATYYAQRASAGLIISEGIQPSVVGQGYTSTPGLHSREQVDSWKPVTAAVHEQDGVIFAQLMHTGRIGHPSLLPGDLTPVAPSSVAAQGQIFTFDGMQDLVEPRELTPAEIAETIQEFADAARNAIDAGFDGVEIHGANGYLVHQFLASHANHRTDEWGGDAEARTRFAVEVTAAVADAIGADKVGIRISPGGTFNDMKDDEDLDATYGLLISRLATLGIAYLHIMEAPGGRGLTERLRKEWPTTLVLNPNTHPEPTGLEALSLVEAGTADVISYGALFLANPDLPARLAATGPFNAPDPTSFYGGTELGYTDYPRLS